MASHSTSASCTKAVCVQGSLVFQLHTTPCMSSAVHKTENALQGPMSVQIAALALTWCTMVLCPLAATKEPGSHQR